MTVTETEHLFGLYDKRVEPLVARMAVQKDPPINETNVTKPMRSGTKSSWQNSLQKRRDLMN